MADQSRPTARPGRKPAADKDAPHGRDASGKPLAPHGLLANGKPRIKPKKEITVETSDVASALTELPESFLAATKRRNARSERQRAMDELVQKTYDRWQAAGKPAVSDWAKLPKAVYRVKDPKAVESLKTLARNACTHLRKRPIFGTVVRDKEGYSVLAFGVVDMVPKKVTKK